MTNLQKLTKLIIKGNHPGKTYEEALEGEERECSCEDYCSIEYHHGWLPITIGRVMVALGNKMEGIWDYDKEGNIIMIASVSEVLLKWLLQAENRLDNQEATLKDQSKETITKLLELLS